MTKLQIFNLALGRIGSFTVASVDEDSNEAQHCRTHWDNDRRSLLKDFPWNFATTEEDLSEVDSASLFDYDHAYQLPSDYLKAIRFNGIEAGTKHDYFKIAEGNLLHTDVESESATLEYIRDVIDCTKWDDVFVKAFSYYLAASVAPMLSKDPNLAIKLLQVGQSFLSDSKGSDLQESKLEIIRGPGRSHYQAARRGNGSHGAPWNWMLYPAGPPN
jgi:hypothetical protein